jgi:drug/metabolite transporter (DMT)-like permease
MKNRIKLHPDIMLLLVAIIWGVGFIATEYAIDSHLHPFQIMAGRFSIAALFLLLFVKTDLKGIHKSQWLKGSIAGSFLFLGFFFQTLGQSMTTVSNSAFLTATNVVFVPFIAWLMTKQRPKTKVFFLAALTFVGIAVLTVDTINIGTLNIGDFYVFLCAIAFASHIAYISIAVKDNNPIQMTLIQMLAAAVLSIAGVLVVRPANLSEIHVSYALPAVLFFGLFSTCLCFLLQTSAQKRTASGKAAIILSTESLFGTIFSVIIGFESLTAKIVIGGLIIFTSVTLMEVKIPLKTGKKRHVSKVSSPETIAADADAAV